jgi:hypothetical protein
MVVPPVRCPLGGTADGLAQAAPAWLRTAGLLVGADRDRTWLPLRVRPLSQR